MTCGLVHASYSLSEWQSVKLTFFAPCLKQTIREINLFAAVRQSPLKFSNDCLIC